MYRITYMLPFLGYFIFYKIKIIIVIIKLLILIWVSQAKFDLHTSN